MSEGTRTITVDYLARVEGEGALHLVVRDGRVERASLSIFEAPRFFEALLVGRDAREAVDITARICGICPVAYQLSGTAAIEDAWGVTVPPEVTALRRLLLAGEWIGSHALHVHMLHAPDFLGYPDAMAMARDHPDAVRRGLKLKQYGNAIMALLGGREIHPVNLRVGGFWRAPSRARIADLSARAAWAVEAAEATVDWVAGLDFPAFERDYRFLAVADGASYPLAPGPVASTVGDPVPPSRFEEVVEEIHAPHSTALHAVLVGHGAYMTGPQARFALAGRHLSPLATAAAARAGLAARPANPFRSILVRAVEILHAAEEALALIEGYVPPDPPAVPVEPRAATGHGVIEAPRGLLYQRYRTAADGTVEAARIVPPTAQNQRAIEADLADVAGLSLDLPDEALRARCEQAIRNYDPCISCATHFLSLSVDRG